MNSRILVVSAADEAYADLLADLARSLRSLDNAPAFEFACLDLGLSAETRARLAPSIDHFAAARWPFPPDPRFDAKPIWAARAVRPFIPDYWPGYDIYVWLDADAWVQEARALSWLIEAAGERCMAVVPAVDRAYTHSTQSRQWLLERYRMALGDDIARRLMAGYYINAGVWALRGDAPHWEAWKRRFAAALENWRGEFLSDQAIVNALLILDRLPAHFLPSECNWLCHLAQPIWDGARRRLCMPNFPFDPIGILHNTWDDKRAAWRLAVRGGPPITTGLTYGAISRIPS